MFKKISNRISKIPPHVAIIILIGLVVGGALAALLLSRSEPKADALVVPRAARVERVDGSVGVARAQDRNGELQWSEAELNSPLSVGDRIYADKDSRTAIAFTGRNYARLDPRSSLDVLSLADRRTQLALRNGSAIFDIGELAPEELFEVATPNGAVDFYEPGLYQVGIGDDGNTLITVLSGLAQVVGLGGSGQLSKGDILTLVAQAAGPLILSKIAPDLAGGILDDYYGYRYPYTYDGRYSDYDVYLDDPDYYDYYPRSVSYQYLPIDVAGAYDLDYYGDWIDVDGYGHCWSPRVNDDWAPYRYGYWDTSEVWGPTWVSDEPWGWAPYHYGRWTQASGRWIWVPQEVISQPVYSPALVAFVPLAETNQIAWVPLAPGESYVPRYYDTNFTPQYLTSPEVVTQAINVQQTYVNMSVPAAVTAVPVQQFSQYIGPDVVTTVSPQLIAQAKPVLDPYAVPSIRETVTGEHGKQHKFKITQEVAQQFNTPVVTSVKPVVPSARGDIAQMTRAETVPDKQKKNKLKIENSGQVVASSKNNGQTIIPQPGAPAAAQEQQQRIAALRERAGQGDKSAKREMKRLERQQQAPVVNQGRAVQQQSVQQAVQSREQRKAEKRAARQQQSVYVPQPARPAMATERQQRKAQKQAERQLMIERQTNQAAAQQAARQAQYQREAQKAQKRAERQQQQQVVKPPQAYRQQPQYRQPPVMQQTDKQQYRMEKRAARQQAAQQQPPPQQVYRAPAYNNAPARSVPQSQQSQPGQSDKAQRKAEKAARRGGKGN